jgi:predicted nucleic acid-binding protein
MTADTAQEALADFDEWRTRSTASLPISELDVSVAARLVRDFATKLAAAEALHLAAAIHAGAKLVTFDSRLLQAARMKGEPWRNWGKRREFDGNATEPVRTVPRFV